MIFRKSFLVWSLSWIRIEEIRSKPSKDLIFNIHIGNFGFWLIPFVFYCRTQVAYIDPRESYSYIRLLTLFLSSPIHFRRWDYFTPCRFYHDNISWVTGSLPQISKTILCVLVDFNHALVWMISTLLLIFCSSSHFSRPSGTVPSAQAIIGITVTFMIHSFFNSLERSKY